MSRKTSFEEAQDLPENCGVDFGKDCGNVWEDYFPTHPGSYEATGECEEDDEECLYRRLILNQRSHTSDTGTSKQGHANSQRGSLRSTHLSSHKSVGMLDRDGKLSQTMRNGADGKTNAIMFPEVINTPYEGLGPGYFKKNFKPDYPTDLQMRQICTPKPLRRRTVGTSKTQPKAMFVPSSSSLRQTPPPSSQRRDTGASSRATSIKYEGNEEPSALEQNRLPPPIVSSSDEVLVDWLEDHNIQMMFEYFLGLCVIHQPEEPWKFLSELVGKMIEARQNLEAFDSLPRLLSPEHTEAIFRIYDRIENGYITMAQYKSAMEAMGLNRFSLSPEGWEENCITKNTFVMESTEAISDLLRSFMVHKEMPVEEPVVANVELTVPETGINLRSASESAMSSGEYSTSDKSRNETANDLRFNELRFD